MENMQIVNICMLLIGYQISNVVVERNGYTNADHVICVTTCMNVLMSNPCDVYR